VVTDNACEMGGGTWSATAENCVIAENTSSYLGGAAGYSTLRNCTVTRNNAGWYGAAAYQCTVRNSIVYGNSGGNYGDCSFSYSCTDPYAGGDNICENPQFANATAGNYRLQVSSPCANAGTNAYAVGSTDLDGASRIQHGTVDMGAYELGGLFADLVPPMIDSISPSNAYVTTEASVAMTITAHDNVRVTRLTVNGAAAAYGNTWQYMAVLGLGSNEMKVIAADAVGNAATTMVTYLRAEIPIGQYRYVNANNPNPSFPYATWETAAQDIQAALDTTVDGNTVLVTNGTYLLTSGIEVQNAVTVQSVNGAAATVVDGQNQTRCFHVTGGGIIEGFTITRGYVASADGAGVQGGVVRWCRITGNTGAGSSPHGGGAANCLLQYCVVTDNACEMGGGTWSATAENCVIAENTSSYLGGAAGYSTLRNCTVTRNNAGWYGAAAYQCTVRNSIVYGNSGGNYGDCSFSYSCTDPYAGGDNICENPQFANATAGNYRLQASSPCINAACNADAPGSVDLAGTNRILFGYSDMGAYEATIVAEPIVKPAIIDFSTNQTALCVFLGNRGSLTYNFTIEGPASNAWLSIAPCTGFVTNHMLAIAAFADRSLLENGTSWASFTITPSPWAGNAHVISARVVVADNTVVANANGPYATDQGSPVSFTAAGSSGMDLSYCWRVDETVVAPFSGTNLDYVYTDTMQPCTSAVMVIVRDEAVPPHVASNTTTLIVRNVAPRVSIGDSLVGCISSPVWFVAVVVDPGVLDSHKYQWDFDGNGTWDTEWLVSNTVCHLYTAAATYPVICEVRDNHGGTGTDVATVSIAQPNQPPVATAVVTGTSLTETNLHGLGLTVGLDGRGSYDPDGGPSPLTFDWREDVDNPLQGLIAPEQAHGETVSTAPLAKPGIYRFNLAVFDGEYVSGSAIVTVRVPGWGGRVISAGYIPNVPLPGVTVTVTNQSTAAEHRDVSDAQGLFLVDAGVGTQRALLRRGTKLQECPISIGPEGEFTDNICFTPTYYIYAGQVVTGLPGAYGGISGAILEVLLGDGQFATTDHEGLFGFPALPETWPPTAAPHMVRIQKSGYASLLRTIVLTNDVNSEFIVLTPAAGTVQVTGTVFAQGALQRVAEVTVEFASNSTAVTDTNGNFGPVSMPAGEYLVMLKKHGWTRMALAPIILVPGATNLTMEMHGNRVIIEGMIFGANGLPITNAVISRVDGATRKSANAYRAADPMAASDAGYYRFDAAQGACTWSVTAPGCEPVHVTIDAHANTKQDIIMVPEPQAAAILLSSLLLGWRRRLVRHSLYILCARS